MPIAERIRVILKYDIVFGALLRRNGGGGLMGGGGGWVQLAPDALHVSLGVVRTKKYE